jgi:hypothetical protein
LLFDHLWFKITIPIARHLLKLTRLLFARLERVFADSYWAHHASGVRRSLIRLLEKIEHGRPVHESQLKPMMDLGFSF